MTRFYIGLEHPYTAWPFLHCMFSIRELRRRKKDFLVNNWMLDSGAFRELELHGAYQHSPEQYAEEINRWGDCGLLQAAVTQDYMCEGYILAKTGLTVAEHQKLTIERYVRISEHTFHYVLPVLQGYTPAEYIEHIALYGDLLPPSAWVGVGSVCKRNGNPDAIEDVLTAINEARSDLKLHAFGIKKTALARPTVRKLLYSADSMAWSFAGTHEKYRGKKDEHDPRRAAEYAAEVEMLIRQPAFIQQQLFNWWID